jgi:hypothetical protein
VIAAQTGYARAMKTIVGAFLVLSAAACSKAPAKEAAPAPSAALTSASAAATGASPGSSAPAVSAPGVAPVVTASIDAGVVAPLAPAVHQPIEIADLPVIPVPVDAKGPGPDVEAYMVDANLDAVLLWLWPRDTTALMLTHGGKVTGSLVARSQRVAVDAYAKHLGLELKPPALSRARSATVEFYLAEAPALDLFRVMADVLRVNIIVPGEPPKLNVRARKIPAAALVDAEAAVLGRVAIRQGNTIYVIPTTMKLPLRPKASNVVIDLDVKEGTVGQAVTAIRALTPFPFSGCSTTKLTVRLRKTSVAEAARALGVMSGAPLEPGDACAPTDTAEIDTATVHLVAVARTGTRRVAIVERAGKTLVVRPSATIEIGAGYVSDGTTSAALYSAIYTRPAHLETYAQWLTTVQRTSAVIRVGTGWTAVLETDQGWEAVYGDYPTEIAGYKVPAPARFSSRGVELPGPQAGDPYVLIPLAK